MSDLNVVWEEGALKLLESRDRYTRNVIREEFRRDPQKDAVEIDPVRQSYLTPVSEGRFSVLWRLGADNQAVVRAVVPLTETFDAAKLGTEPERDKLKEYVRRAVTQASNGEIRDI